MSTKTSIKRIALVAVSALGFGLLSVVPAKAAAGDTITGTVSPVRVTFTTAGGTTTQDNVPAARLSWVSDVALASGDTYLLTLTSAPSANAKVRLGASTTVGTNVDTTSAGNGISDEFTDALTASLTANGEAFTGGELDQTGGDSASAPASVSIMADTAGTYVGTLEVWDVSATPDVLVNTVRFSFTTRGAVSTVTLTSSAAETSPLGTATLTTTLRDSAGNVTQPLVVDGVNLADDNTTPATITNTSLSAVGGHVAQSLYDGVASTTYTNTSVVGSLHNITATPTGTLGGLASSTVSITVNSTTIATDAAAITAITLSAPAARGSTSGALTARAVSVSTGSSSITVAFTGAASSTYRLKLTSDAGTVNGASGATPQYVTATTSSTGSGSVTYTLGGAALILNKISVVEFVKVNNNALDTVRKITVTQADPTVTADTVYLSPTGNIVRQIGATTSVTASVFDQYGNSMGAGYTIRAYRGTVAAGTLLSTATTNAAGDAVLTVTSASTAVNNSSETYYFSYVLPGVAGETQITETVVATYTTSGNITNMSTAITGHTGITLSTVLDTTTTAAQLVVPAVRIPADGRANNVDANGGGITGDGTYTKATAALSATPNNAELIALNTTNTPGNSTTFSSSTGAFLCSTTAPTSTVGGCLWNAGVTSIEVSAGGTIYAFAQKTGLHTITATSGGKTTSIQFWAYNLETNYYTLTANADKTTLVAGSNGVVTIDVKDIFGNIVDTANNLLTATAEGKVRLAGQALTQDMGTTSTGSFSFTVVADSTAGTGTVTIAPGTRASAWGATYVKPTGAADPVRTVTLTFTVTAATAKTTDDAVAAAVAAEVEAKKATTEAAAAVAAAKEATAAATKAATDAVAAAKAAGDAAVAAAKAAGDAAVAAAVKAALDAVAASKAAQDAAVAEAQAATEAAAEAIDASNAATDAANIAAEAADAATVAAEEARDAADAATAAVEELATQVSTLFASLKAQLTTLANTVAKIAKKVRA